MTTTEYLLENNREIIQKYGYRDFEYNRVIEKYDHRDFFDIIEKVQRNMAIDREVIQKYDYRDFITEMSQRNTTIEIFFNKTQKSQRNMTIKILNIKENSQKYDEVFCKN